MRSIKGRLFAFAALWITLALAGAWMVIGHVLHRFIEDRYRTEMQAVAEALVASADVDDEGRVILQNPPADPRFSLPLSGWYWQVGEGDRVVAKSLSLLDGQIAPSIRMKLPPLLPAEGPDGELLAVLTQYYSIPDLEPMLRISVSAPAAEMAARERQVREPLAKALMVLAAGLVAAVALQIWAGLASLRALGRDIGAIRAGKAEHLSPPRVSELDPVVADMNALLDQNRAVVARSREHLGNLAHSLKTPLAALANGMPPDDPGQALIARMDRQIGWHLRRARSAGASRLLGQRTEVAPVVDDILMVLKGPMQTRGVTARNDSGTATFAGERQDLEELVGNLTENAVKWAQSKVVISARTEGNEVILCIEDDGPGMADKDYATALTRGARLDEQGAPGTGLGLAIVTDLAKLHGGGLWLSRSPLGGLRAELRLPAASG